MISGTGNYAYRQSVSVAARQKQNMPGSSLCQRVEHYEAKGLDLLRTATALNVAGITLMAPFTCPCSQFIVGWVVPSS